MCEAVNRPSRIVFHESRQAGVSRRRWSVCLVPSFAVGVERGRCVLHLSPGPLSPRAPGRAHLWQGGRGGDAKGSWERVRADKLGTETVRQRRAWERGDGAPELPGGFRLHGDGSLELLSYSYRSQRAKARPPVQQSTTCWMGRPVSPPFLRALCYGMRAKEELRLFRSTWRGGPIDVNGERRGMAREGKMKPLFRSLPRRQPRAAGDAAAFGGARRARAAGGPTRKRGVKKKKANA